MRKANKNNQSAKFVEAAREHGCDESEETFSAKLKELTKPQYNFDDAAVSKGLRNIPSRKDRE